MRISIATLGCKVNQAESTSLEQGLEASGHVVVPFGQPADAVVVNSCSVTHRSDRDTRALVRRARRANPGARLIVTGCYAQLEPAALMGLGADAVVGTDEKLSISTLLAEGRSGVLVGDVAQIRELAPAPVGRSGQKARSFFKVQDGCQCFCAYCIVPFARGPSRSLRLEDVRDGLARIRAAGYREVVLAGIHLGLWGRDLAPPLPFSALLGEAERSQIPRVRLSSLEPGELTPELVERMASSNALCPHLHVPLQSGSDRVLSAMGRPYSAAEFRSRVGAALDAVSGLCLGLDVIAGFPGEDDAAFDETREFLEGLAFAYLHVFPFSARRGTRAFDRRDRVPEATVRNRARSLRDLSRAKRAAFHASQKGRVLLALPEGSTQSGWLAARTRNYLPVRFRWAGPAPEGEVPVQVTGVGEEFVTGTCTSRSSSGG